MKFITEDDLRDKYKKEPLSVYVPPDGTKLTPGARQFLIDRGIFEEASDDVANVYGGKLNLNGGNVVQRNVQENTNRYQKSDYEYAEDLIEMVRADFYKAGYDLLGDNIHTAQRLMTIATALNKLKPCEDRKRCDGASGDEESNQNAHSNAGNNSNSINKSISNNGIVPDIKGDLNFAACTGIKDDNFDTLLKDCFYIGEFHAQHEHAKEILILHQLRCRLRHAEAKFNKYAGSDLNLQAGTKGLRQTINILSRMICAAFGSKVCQKQT
ncbi:MAG: hypothetical protein LBN22_01050 [Clostridiales Family XIII bacterium]|jgi:ethanolamine utilization cobalamin adenosyltransferase|nr:hypothetical protein [Clostridiales Family XIII bacterium]